MTSSVGTAGVLLVFSYLIVPAAVGALLSGSVAGRLAIGWTLGALVSALGLWASFAWDLPTGAAVVTTFGAVMAAVAGALGLRSLAQRVRERGWEALRGVGIVACAAIGLAGMLLAAFPHMDHHWLDWTEEAAPVVQLIFLTPAERRAWRDSREALERGMTELRRLKTLEVDVQWGRAGLTAEQQERLRQFLASRGEITAGDRFVLKTLRGRARERQRFWLGLPLLALGLSGALALTPRRLRDG